MLKCELAGYVDDTTMAEQYFSLEHDDTSVDHKQQLKKYWTASAVRSLYKYESMATPGIRIQGVLALLCHAGTAAQIRSTVSIALKGYNNVPILFFYQFRVLHLFHLRCPQLLFIKLPKRQASVQKHSLLRSGLLVKQLC